jgi:hypothetical protein
MNAKPPPAPTDAMTPKESWYLDCLRTWISRRGGRSPSLIQLAGFCRKSRTAVYSALLSLENKGYVTRIGEEAADGDKRRARFFKPVNLETS